MEDARLQNSSTSKIDVSDLDPLLNQHEKDKSQHQSDSNNQETKVLTITSTNIEEQIQKSDEELFSSLWEDKHSILGKGNICMVKLSQKEEELESRERLLLLREQKCIESRTKMIQLHKKLLEHEVELLDKEMELKKRELLLLDHENQTN